MTRRDLVWRSAGFATFAAAMTIAVIDRIAIHEGLALPCFVVAIGGLVLMVQGKRVPAAWRIERSRHRDLPEALSARRHRHTHHDNP